MRGLSAALTIVVAAIVLLVVAVVILTIFGGAVAPFGGLAEAVNNCKLQARTSCAAAGQLPATWGTDTQRFIGPDGSQVLRACRDLNTGCSCVQSPPC